MECYVEVSNEELSYTVQGFPGNMTQAMEHFFFSKDERGYTKKYNTTTFMYEHDVELLQRNFAACLPRMIDQFIGTEAMPWEDTLSETIEILKAYDIAWWLAGSGACAARGIDMAPHDIDIMTYLEEVPKIQKAFEAYTVEPFHFVSDWITKGFGVVFLGGRVDVAFEPADDADQYGKLDYGVYASEHLEEIAWHDHRIQVPPVELHLPGNESRNRHDRIKLINDYIAAL